MHNLGAGGIGSVPPKWKPANDEVLVVGDSQNYAVLFLGEKKEDVQGRQNKQKATKQNKPAPNTHTHTQVSTLRFKVFFMSTFTEFVILKWCPAKSIPRFTTFYLVTIYAFAIILQNLFSFSVSHTLQWKPRHKESNFLAVGHPIKYVLIYALDCKYLLARKLIK